MVNGEDRRDAPVEGERAEAEAAAGEAGATGRDQAEEERLEREFMAAMREEMRRVSVADYLVGLLVSLSSMAFQRLGLTPDTAEDRDLDQSRLAIDAFGSLVEVLAAARPEEEIAMYRSTLHQMRLAYVTTVEAEGTVDEGAPPSTAEGETPRPTEEGQEEKRPGVEDGEGEGGVDDRGEQA